MASSLFLILAVAGLILLWLDGARARELATGVVDELCLRRGFQLLDGTVALSRVGLAQTGAGIRIKRLFRFDYSIEGAGRLQGHILLHGSRVVEVDLHDPPQPATPEPPRPIQTTRDDDPKVIPFRRRH